MTREHAIALSERLLSEGYDKAGAAPDATNPTEWIVQARTAGTESKEVEFK